MYSKMQKILHLVHSNEITNGKKNLFPWQTTKLKVAYKIDTITNYRKAE